MYLRELVLKGFKSFPERTRLTFGPGVSVIVGPNGSGKSNVTDAVLWAMGEQSPLAVRGASMQDVIFGGGHGRVSGSAAEVELVLDNGCGTLGVDFPEVSIVRRLDRAGEGEYRLNGARCRLVDVLEVLSDTGLGKEMHSVVSQGRVEGIVTSKPRDRRLLVEEAAGLGKHRKRRRRTQLKLDRTRENLDRALDVEREARARLKPLKRQAEAAELHERLERQALEARWALARDDLLAAESARALAEADAAGAGEARRAAEDELADVGKRRERAEEALSARSAQREELSGRAYSARGAGERIALRLEGARGQAAGLADRVAQGEAELRGLEAETLFDSEDAGAAERLRALGAEHDGLERDAEARLAGELAELEERERAAVAALHAGEEEERARRELLTDAEEAAEEARRTRREAERGAEAARREAARVGAELAAVNQFLRTHAGAPGGGSSLADALGVPAGDELALAAALGPALGAALVPDRAAGAALLERAGRDGGAALVAGAPGAAIRSPSAGADPIASPSADSLPGPSAPSRAAPLSRPPVAGARRLLDLVSGPSDALALAGPLLADTWVVDDVAAVPGDFTGVAVTRAGRTWAPARRELRQVPPGGGERVLAERNRREGLLARTEQAASAERAGEARIAEHTAAHASADARRDEAEAAARAAARARDVAGEEVRRVRAAIEHRRRAPHEGAGAVRRAQVLAEIAAERRVAERAAAQREERARRVEAVGARLASERALVPAATELVDVLAAAVHAVLARGAAFDDALRADRAAGDALAADLRACAQEEAGVQTRLLARAEEVTRAEVAAQRARDGQADATRVLAELAGRLEQSHEAATRPLDASERDVLAQRLERLARRRELLGPVNPLAQDEYAEALAHVEELEAQREDLEAALRELADLLRDTDAQIRETFEETFAAAAKNFEEVVGHLFPGGRGALRLVTDEPGLSPVLGGERPEDEKAGEDDEKPELGVEIEITPAGKATKRLSLLSGGEKSLTALAFLFAVFLARPCPFYILDEVEAALDDPNITRFLELLRRFGDRAQFIVVTHQKRTMEAADVLYGVSMGGDGVSQVVSRRLEPDTRAAA